MPVLMSVQVGAGHGGEGGLGSTTTDTRGNPNDNLLKPVSFGSGGHLTRGGGVLHIIGGTITLDGTISAKYVQDF